MQTIIETSKRVIAHAAHERRAHAGHWKQNHEEDTISDDETREQLEADSEEVLQELRQFSEVFHGSLTAEQQTLKASMEQAQRERDIMGDDVYIVAESAYKGSLSQEQAIVEETITKLTEEHTSLQEALLKLQLGIRDDAFLTWDISTDMSKHTAYAVLPLINTAINLSQYDQTSSPSYINTANLLFDEKKRTFTLHTNDNAGDINLERIVEMLDEHLADPLKNPENWKKMTVRKEGSGYGIPGFVIEAPVYQESLAFNVAHSLSQEPEFQNDVSHVYIVDGSVMSGEQYVALTRRETDEGGEQEHDVKRRLILTGNAADKILAAMGVEQSLIKEVRRAGR